MPSHDQWMAWCEAGARIFSTCSRRSYMSVVLSSTGRVLGTGYNGTPSGIANCNAGGCDRASTDVAHGSSYSNCSAVHSEANALLHSDRSARDGGTLYVNGPPCWECSKLIAGSGIKTVVFKRDPAYVEFSKCYNLLHSVGITLVAFPANSNELGNDSHSSSFWLATPISVDLASRAGNRIHLDGSDCPVAALGNDPLDSGDDGPYTP